MEQHNSNLICASHLQKAPNLYSCSIIQYPPNLCIYKYFYYFVTHLIILYCTLCQNVHFLNPFLNALINLKCFSSPWNSVGSASALVLEFCEEGPIGSHIYISIADFWASEAITRYLIIQMVSGPKREMIGILDLTDSRLTNFNQTVSPLNWNGKWRLPLIPGLKGRKW